MDVETDWLTVDLNQLDLLSSGDYIRYTKVDDETNKLIKGYVRGKWNKEGLKGFVMGYALGKGGTTWTVIYNNIHEVQKKVNKNMTVEFKYLLDRISELEQEIAVLKR